MSGEHQIQVNFGKPMPLFPLEQIVLLPQQFLPLHIFEPRYRQMVEKALDGAGQFAMAVYAEPPGPGNPNPPLRPAVCVAQIVQHEKLPDGRYNILVQGVCRARVHRELPPEKDRAYRAAYLEPVGLGLPTTAESLEAVEGEEMMRLAEETSPALVEARNRIGEMLGEGPLTQMMHSQAVLEYVRNEELPTQAILELVSFTLITDPNVRYQLLAEPHVENRARMIIGELEHLSSLIRRAGAQHPERWPKGCSWN
jgi:Lon protease-like protein